MDCTDCPQLPPHLTPGLDVFLKLYLHLAPALTDAWGSLNMAAWESGLRLLTVSPAWWPELTRKLIRLFSLLNEKQKTDNGHIHG